MSSTRAAFALAAVTLLAHVAGCKSCSPSRPKPYLYVTDEDGGYVVVVDPQTALAVARVAVGKRPRGVKVSHDGKLLYVALSGSPRGGPGVDESKLPPPDWGADGVGIVDVERRVLVRTLDSGPDPESFDLSPDDAWLYVSNEETAEMTTIDLSTGAIRGKTKVGREPEGVTVRPDGKVVFVTSEEDNEVTVVDTKSLAVVAHVPTGPRPRNVAFTADGATAFVTDEFGAMLTVVDAVAYKPAGDIKVHLDSPMPVGPRPMGAVLSRDGKQLYVTTGRGGSVAIIDVATRAQVRSIDGVGDRPWGVALSADGSHLYTANGTSGDLSIVNIATGNVDRRVRIGGLPWGVALGPSAP